VNELRFMSVTLIFRDGQRYAQIETAETIDGLNLTAETYILDIMEDEGGCKLYAFRDAGISQLEAAFAVTQFMEQVASGVWNEEVKNER
jgi:hypothetical protein